MSAVGNGKRLGWRDLGGTVPKGGNVLVVDDDERVRKALRRSLLEMGHSVHIAASAEEADQWLSQSRFDLVLLDIDLPRMSGLEFLASALTRDPEMATIMVTGHDSASLALECLAAGARTYLVKPVDPAFLQAAVNDALAMRWLLVARNDHAVG